MKSFSILAAALLFMGAAANPPRVTLDCRLSITIEDHADHERIDHWCHTTTETFRVELPKDVKPGQLGQTTGRIIKITGEIRTETNSQGRTQRAIYPADFRDFDMSFLPLMSDSPMAASQVVVPSGNAPWNRGIDRVLVANVSYPGNPSQYTNQQIKDLFANKMTPLLNELSKGTAGMVVDVVDVTVPGTSNCDVYTVMDAAQAVAEAKGFKDQLNPWAPYRRAYSLPFSGCPYRGLASVGGSGGNFALFHNQLIMGVTDHELFGHFRFGLYHEITNTWNSLNCCRSNYSGGPGFMGNQGGVLGPWHLKIAGFMDAPGMPSSFVVTQSGDYVINPITSMTIDAKAAFIHTAVGELSVSYYRCEGHYATTGQPCDKIYLHLSSGNATEVVAASIDGAVVWPLEVGKTFHNDLIGAIWITNKLVGAQAVINVAFAPPAPPVPPASINLTIQSAPTKKVP